MPFAVQEFTYFGQILDLFLCFLRLVDLVVVLGPLNTQESGSAQVQPPKVFHAPAVFLRPLRLLLEWVTAIYCRRRDQVARDTQVSQQ